MVGVFLPDECLGLMAVRAGRRITEEMKHDEDARLTKHTREPGTTLHDDSAVSG